MYCILPTVLCMGGGQYKIPCILSSIFGGYTFFVCYSLNISVL